MVWLLQPIFMAAAGLGDDISSRIAASLPDAARDSERRTFHTLHVHPPQHLVTFLSPLLRWCELCVKTHAFYHQRLHL